MKQIIQDIRSGEVSLVTVPAPACGPGGVLVRTVASAISAGTERMLIELGSASLLGKARARPDLVRQVVSKAKKEGLGSTYRSVRTKMERPMPLGYSAAGVVVAIGSDVRGVSVGERVAVAGAGYANHAEYNFVPLNLIAGIPDSVPSEDAAYTTIASISLQGVRLAQPAIGEHVAVIGLGLIGLITVQILKTNGCRVVGIDLDAGKVKRGLDLGMDAGVAASEDVEETVASFTGGRGVDHVIITASTASNDPVIMAGEITRRRGHVVVVGAVGMDIPRNVYYQKELTLQVSMSYGPGRYDPVYEERGIDYPYEFVRWTEQRNMEAILGLLESGSLDVSALTTHSFAFDDALEAYELIRSGSEPYVGVVLRYPVTGHPVSDSKIVLRSVEAPTSAEVLRVGFAGAGNYASLHLLPRLSKSSRVHLTGLVTATGVSSKQAGDKFGFDVVSTDVGDLLGNDTDAVFIATRHSTHAELVVEALNKGKHVFVEKPISVSEAELEEIRSAYEHAQLQRPTALMVGLNRRFSPMIRKLRDALSLEGPCQMIYRVNSGPIPLDSWMYDPAEGGGMLIGEMCHFVDTMQYVCGAHPTEVFARSMKTGRDDVADRDNIVITVSFSNGSVGTLAYSTVGDKSAPKEHFQVFAGGSVALLDDFRSLVLFSGGRRNRSRSSNQDKGQANMIAETIDLMRTARRAPVGFDTLYNVMSSIFAASGSLQTGTPVTLQPLQYEHEAAKNDR